MTKRRYTLEEIEARRAYLACRIREKSDSIARRWDDIASPRGHHRGAGWWMSRAVTAWSIYDGVIVGYKLCHLLNRLFGRRRR